MSDPLAAVPLLECLWPGSGWGELRALHGPQRARPYWVRLDGGPRHLGLGLEWAARANDAGHEAYFGVHPRARPRGLNDAVTSYTALIADLDRPAESWPAVQALVGAGLPPSACVRTSRGVHLYWFLQQPEDADPAGPARERMRRLQIAIGSDAVHDAARILRLPGSTAWSEVVDRARQPRPTPNLMYVAWLEPGRRVTSAAVGAAVDRLWPALPVVHVPAPLPSAPNGCIESADALPPAILARALAPWPRGQRSEHALAVLRECAARGWSDERIEAYLPTLPLWGHYEDRGFGGRGALRYDLQKVRASLDGRVFRSGLVLISRASVLCGADGTYLRLGLRHLEGPFEGSTTSEYLRLPDAARPDTRRWSHFFSAAGLKPPVPDPSSPELWTLEGRRLGVDVTHIRRPRVVRFYPPAGAQV